MSRPLLLPNPWIRAAQWTLPIGVIGLVAVMVVPLSPWLLDLLISLDIALSMVVLLAAVYVRSPLQFSAFPSVLLLLTVFRLGLNVASTRRILLHGYQGPDAAGHVIRAFGQFVVGGNLVVGLVIFLVLLAVQFIVINHGATRISEVAARFTLDAMPGKQMAIDADLNAGVIDEAEARERRRAIAAEAEFYGAMDGAIRFTQRDAIASLIIVAINLLAGLAIGVLQAGMALGEAVRVYSLLTVGDGLVSAIPALLVSVTGGLLTTRSAMDERELGSQVADQLLGQPKSLAVAAGALGVLALVPGMPTLAFLTLAAGTGALASLLFRERRAEAERSAPPEPASFAEEPIEPLLALDPLTIEVGYELVELAGSERSGGLLQRIRAIRRQIALELGLIVPPVRVRDNLRLAPDEYQILLRGYEIGRARLPRGRVLAMDPGDASEPVPGEKTRDPAFGIEALWIDDNLAEHARQCGYTVVDRASVLATHLSELIRRHAAELLGRQETQRLLDHLSKTAPKLVEELVPERYSLGQIQRVLQGLLAERVSIRDLQTILETLGDCAGEGLETAQLVNRVRQALGRSLVRPLAESGQLHAVSLAPELEEELRQWAQGTADGLDPRRAQAFVHRILATLREAGGSAQPVLLCRTGEARSLVRKLTRNVLPTVPVLCALEIPDGVRVQVMAQVR